MSDDSGVRQPLLKISGLSKHFGGVQALAGVDFDLLPHEIHALLGENGAGKSTLIKILAGVEKADAGTINVTGADRGLHHMPRKRRGPPGLYFVHQDLGLIEELSVAENLALDVGYTQRLGLIRFRATERRAQQLLDQMGCDISARSLVGDLVHAEKVMVAVTRAFSTDADVVVLDEATASLAAPEVERLTELLRNARATGMGFIFVTHRLDEIFGLADRVTVLRDGCRVATAVVDEVDRRQIVEWIVGKEVREARKNASAMRVGSTPLLQVRQLEGRGLSAPVTFDVAPGEVLALTGLIGSGARVVVQILGGSIRPTGGTATLDGVSLKLGKPRSLAAAGCVYVPGDRPREGAIPALTVRENLFPARRAGDSILVFPRAERLASQRLIERFQVRPSDASERPLDTLSGGNQQKVILGRALRSRPRLIVLDDPTMGVDVGSRAEVHQLLRQAADDGCAIVLASSDYDEVVSEADRVLVFRRGMVARELGAAEISRHVLAVESYLSEQELAS